MWHSVKNEVDRFLLDYLYFQVSNSLVISITSKYYVGAYVVHDAVRNTVAVEDMWLDLQFQL